MEIITCGATHGYFPLMDVAKSSIRAQLRAAVSQYEKVFGRAPRGIWLPECGYNPGDDQFLKEAGLKYFLPMPTAFCMAPRGLNTGYSRLFTAGLLR